MNTVQQGASSSGGLLEVLVTVLLAIAVIWIAVMLFRRYKAVKSGTYPAMKIESRMVLGPRKWIVVAKVQSKRLVLGITDQHISLITELPVDETMPQQEANTPAAQIFNDFLHKKKKE